MDQQEVSKGADLSNTVQTVQDVQNLFTEEKTPIAAAMMQTLPIDEKTEVATAMMQNLPAEKQAEVRTTLGTPSSDITARI